MNQMILGRGAYEFWTMTQRISGLILMVIGIIGGHLVWIPVVAFPLALGIGYALQKPLTATLERTMALASERQSSLIETLAGLDAVKVNNAESERQYMWEQTIGTLSRLELRVDRKSVV